MVIGFTGTRRGMTQHQKDECLRLLRDRDGTTAIHGGCIGADEEFHQLAISCGYLTEVYPGYSKRDPSDLSMRADIEADVVHDPDSHFSRNRTIVAACTLLIAAPGSMVVRSGGTWYTINFAKQFGRETVLLAPHVSSP